MNGAWWRSPNELDADQRGFIQLPTEGRYSLTGPPGSGKTNLLLLRMQYLAGRGFRNVLFVTFTRELADFVRQGVSTAGIIQPRQIQTYHSWAYSHVLDHGDRSDLPTATDFDLARAELLTAVRSARAGLPSLHIYDGIFVDEAQDLSLDELRALLDLSPRVCISGDRNQGIYRKDGLDDIESLGLTEIVLHRHYRIGPAIAKVADRLIPPATQTESLVATCNYDSSRMGQSSALMIECATRDEQFLRMADELRVQVQAFPREPIGVLCARTDSAGELRRRFDGTDLADQVWVHGVDDGACFDASRPIHVLSVHSAKGAEFRAVHLYGAEEYAPFPLRRTRIAFTAVTRGKTALRAYRTGETTPALEAAFADEVDFDWRSLLPETGDD